MIVGLEDDIIVAMIVGLDDDSIVDMIVGSEDDTIVDMIDGSDDDLIGYHEIETIDASGVGGADRLTDDRATVG